MLLILSVGTSSLLGSLSFTVSAQQETAEQFVERVKQAIKNDEWGRAQSGIRRALALNPESPEANLVAAQVYWHEGARSMAIDALNKAIQSQPIFPEAHLLLARCLQQSKKLDDARGEVNLAISQGAPLFPAYRVLAEIDIAKQDYEAAILSLQTAVRYTHEGDTAERTRTQNKIQELREVAERFKRFADLEANQKTADIVRPRLLEAAQTRYTEGARAQKIQGSVLLGILINEN